MRGCICPGGVPGDCLKFKDRPHFEVSSRNEGYACYETPLTLFAGMRHGYLVLDTEAVLPAAGTFLSGAKRELMSSGKKLGLLGRSKSTRLNSSHVKRSRMPSSA